MSASRADSRDTDGVPGGVDWPALPEPLRARLADAAATALSGMEAADVPHVLRRIAGFTPAKRAKLGGPALLAELAGSAAFRAAVMAWWDEHRPGELVADEAADPLTNAAAAVLTGDPHAADAVAATARRVEVGEVKAERDTLLSKVDKLTAELERLRGELTEARAQVREAGQQREAEFLHLRRRLSEQGATLRGALDARTAAEEQMAALRAETQSRIAAAAAECERERGRAEAERRRADRAAAEVAAARQAAREARQADETRLALLVDTLGGAVAGLRRELALGGGGPRPADLVAGAQAAGSGTRVDTVPGLDALLAVPTLHLVVDGYNVSKTGYPELHAGRPAQQADHPARRARRPHPRGDHRGVRRRGRDGGAAPRRAGRAGAVQRAGRARRRRHPFDRRRRAARTPGRGRHRRPRRGQLHPGVRGLRGAVGRAGHPSRPTLRASAPVLVAHLLSPPRACSRWAVHAMLARATRPRHCASSTIDH